MLTQLLSDQLVQAISWTLFHSLWQVSLVAIVLLIMMRLMKSSTPSNRYAIAFGSMLMIVLMTIITFSICFFQGSASDIPVQELSATHLITSAQSSIDNSPQSLWATYSPWIVNAWIIGSIIFAIKLIGGFVFISSVIRKSQMNDNRILEALESLKSKMNINRHIRCFTSVDISSPMVMGVLKPMILFPIGMVNQLTMEEVNAILAHELAHVKRHDFIANIIQSVLETAFYFHPAIWFISKIVRQERELCCDDMAIKQTGNSVSYAKTLIKLQGMRMQNLEPALAMSGSKNQFSDRIKRILNVPTKNKSLKLRLLPLMMVCFCLVGFMEAKNEVQDQENLEVYIIDDCPHDINEIKQYLDTIPERNDFQIKKRKNDRELELHMESGEITKLKIDGEEIPVEDYKDHQDVIEELNPESSDNIITVFPDCGEDFGNIFLLDKERQVFKMDTILKKFDFKLKSFEDMDKGRFDFHVDKFDSEMMDSLLKEANGISWSMIRGGEDEVNIDSIFDLLPEMSELIDTLRMAPKWKKDALGNGMTIWKDGKFKHQIGPQFGKRKYKIIDGPSSGQKVSDVIANELLEDQLIDEVAKSKIELTGKYLKIDGEKQPSNIWKKYKKIYEKNTGISLSKDSKISIEVNPEEIEKKAVFPRVISI